MSVIFNVEKKKVNSLYCSMCITEVRRQGSPEQNIEHHRTAEIPRKTEKEESKRLRELRRM